MFEKLSPSSGLADESLDTREARQIDSDSFVLIFYLQRGGHHRRTQTSKGHWMNIPLSDTIVHAIAQLVDDSNNNGSYREPSHADIEFQVKLSGLSAHDPKQQGQVIGKAKRVRAVLYGALEEAPAEGSKFILGLLSKVRACGGFRPSSDNFVGLEAVENTRAAFESEGYVLASDGSISAKVLDSMRGAELSEALRRYAERAKDHRMRHCFRGQVKTCSKRQRLMY